MFGVLVAASAALLSPSSPGVPLFITGCNLGCSSGGAGMQVSCAVVDVFQNQELRIAFSEPIDPASVNANTVRLVSLMTGVPVAGAYTVEGAGGDEVVFRPALDFDAGGFPVFGLDAGGTYSLFVPGTAQGDPGPFVQSVGGSPNASRMQCSFVASLGVQDPVPGPPQVDVRVTTIDPATGMALPDQPGGGASHVAPDSDVALVFDDVMLPATLLDPQTGALPFIRLELDPDGDLTTLADRVPVAVAASLTIDLAAGETRLLLDPAANLPLADAGAALARVVVTVPAQVTDLVGNPVLNAGSFAFRTQVSAPPLSYCAGKVNSLGCLPFLTTVGLPSVTDADAFAIRGQDLLPAPGFLFYGFGKSNFSFHGGRLCVKAPLTRLLPLAPATPTGPPPCTGLWSRDFNARIQAGADPRLSSGAAVTAQLYQRDPTDPAGFGDSLTDAVRFTIFP